MLSIVEKLNATTEKELEVIIIILLFILFDDDIDLNEGFLDNIAEKLVAYYIFNPKQLNVGLQRPNKFSNVKLYTLLFSK